MRLNLSRGTSRSVGREATGEPDGRRSGQQNDVSGDARSDFSVIQFVDALVDEAFLVRASDIHLDPGEDMAIARVRIDGILRETQVIPNTVHGEVVARIKILCGLRTDEHRAAQDGRFRFALRNGPSIDVRVSIMPTYYGENAVLRLLAEQPEEGSLVSLGFSPENEAIIRRAIRKPHGMILATGPTGSGKTTTLYTLVKMLNVPDVSIITIEDPIEYSINGINQVQVNPRTGLTFANGLRAMLRQDPNVMMVGEIRDTETAGLAVNTALTGHLVLSTLHTNDAPTTLPRLLDMKVEPFLIASTVSIAISQRLVRVICGECRKEVRLTQAEEKSLKEVFPEVSIGSQSVFYKGVGCDACNGTGFRGRTGIHEIMEVDGPIRDSILCKTSAGVLRDLAIRQGMVPIVADGFRKAAAGVTTVGEVLRMRYE